MNDRKNFSALGKIDEKYVEEADAYAAPEAGSERPAANRARRKKLRRRLVCRWAGIAAGLAAVSLACWYAASFFSDGAKQTGDASSLVSDLCPESQDSMDGAGEAVSSPDADREESAPSSDGDCAEHGSGGCSESSSAPA